MVVWRLSPRFPATECEWFSIPASLVNRYLEIVTVALLRTSNVFRKGLVLRYKRTH
jgi:hypothetical protein